MLNKTDRDKLRELCEKATPAPWRTNTKDRTGDDWLIGCILDCGEGVKEGEDVYSHMIVTTDRIRASEVISGGAVEDAEFIAAARNLVPALLDALDEAERDQVECDAQAKNLSEIIERLRDELADRESKLKGLEERQFPAGMRDIIEEELARVGQDEYQRPTYLRIRALAKERDEAKYMLVDREAQHARDLKEALTEHKAECG